MVIRLGLGAAALGFVTGLPFVAGRFTDASHAADVPVHLQVFPAGTPCTYEDSWQAPRGTDASGKALYHEGVDIIAKSGTPIYAAADGTISRMSTSTRGGTQLYLKRSDGTYFFHAHLSAYAAGLKVGDAVTAGQVIAYVGQTGDAVYSVPHLHFEVHPGGGAPVNPFPIVREVDTCYGRTKPPTTTAPKTTTPTPTTPKTTTATTVKGTSGSTGGGTTATGGGLTAVAGARLADSRGRFWLHRQAGGEVQPLTVATRGGVAADASLAALTFTVMNPTASGFLTAFPCGGTVPETSTVNFVAGETVTNAALVGLGASGSDKGKVCVKTNVAADVLVDVTAYASAAGPLGFVPGTPQRLIDTRTLSPVPPGATLRLATGAAATGAGAITANVTSVGARGAGAVTVWPCAAAQPTSPSLTVEGGDIVPVMVTVGIDADGALCVASTSTTDIVVDLMGAWRAGGQQVRAVRPVRLLDTRAGGKLVDAGQTLTIAVAGVSGLPADATGAQVNITSVGTRADGFVTVWPCGAPRPTASTLNPVAGAILANGTLVGLGGGAVCVYSSSPTHLVVDVTGILS